MFLYIQCAYMYREAVDHPKIHPSGMWLDKRESCPRPEDRKVIKISNKKSKEDEFTFSLFKLEVFCTRVNS